MVDDMTRHVQEKCAKERSRQVDQHREDELIFRRAQQYRGAILPPPTLPSAFVELVHNLESLQKAFTQMDFRVQVNAIKEFEVGERGVIERDGNDDYIEQ